MSNLGKFVKTETGFKGTIKTMALDLTDVRFEKEQGPKRTEDSPDYIVYVDGAQVGAGWAKVSNGKGKKPYISALIDDPSMERPLNFTLFATTPDGSKQDALWSRPKANCGAGRPRENGGAGLRQVLSALRPGPIPGATDRAA